MAIFINSNISGSKMWLDELPEIGITTSDRSISFRLEIGTETLYADTLYPYKGAVRVDMLSLVSEYMQTHGTILGLVSLIFTDSENTVRCNIVVIRRRRATAASLQQWVDKRFLSLARGKYLPVGAHDILSAFVSRESTADHTPLTARIDVQYTEPDGTYATLTVTKHAGNRDVVDSVVSFAVTWPEECLSGGRRPVMMTVTLEGRTMTYYHTERECAAIRFCNVFGAPENLFETVSVSQELKASASVGRVRMSRFTYDPVSNQKLSLTFRSCDTSDYTFITQLAESPELRFWRRVSEMSGEPLTPSGGYRLTVESTDFNIDPAGDSSLIPVIQCVPVSPLPIVPDIDTAASGSNGIFTNQFTDQFT